MKITFEFKSVMEIELFANMIGLDLEEATFDKKFFEIEFAFGKFESKLFNDDIFKGVEHWVVTMELCPEATKEFFEIMPAVNKALEELSEYQEFCKKWFNEDAEPKEMEEENRWIRPIIYEMPEPEVITE